MSALFDYENSKGDANPYTVLTEEQVLQKLEVSRKHAEQGLCRDVDDVIADLKREYFAEQKSIVFVEPLGPGREVFSVSQRCEEANTDMTRIPAPMSASKISI